MDLTITTVSIDGAGFHLFLGFDGETSGKLFFFDNKYGVQTAKELIETLNGFDNESTLDQHEVLSNTDEKHPCFYIRHKRTSDCWRFEFDETDAPIVEEMLDWYFAQTREMRDE